MRKFFRRLIQALLVVVIFYCLWQIGSYLWERKQSDDSFASVQEKVTRYESPQKMGSGHKGPFPDLSEQVNYQGLMQELQRLNNDIVAYLEVSGTQIQYPVVQAGNNDYYLRRGINKKYSLPGIPFMDYRNAKDLSDQNTVIYGHMMNYVKTSMFGEFEHFLDQAYVDQSPKLFRLIHPTGVYYYRIIAVVRIHEEEDYREPNKEAQAFLADIEKLRKESVVQLGYDGPLSPNSRVVTLSTCTPDHDRTYRIALIGLLEKYDS